MDEQALTVIIPARNEGAGICPVLHSLLQQSFRGRVRVVVVANRCVQHTLAWAQQAWVDAPDHYELVLLEEQRAGKALALRAGDRVALAGARVYLDADIVLSPNALAAIHASLSPNSGLQLVSPRRSIRPPESRISRAYARVWSSLPSVQHSIIASGVYAVSARGRERWSEFPLLHSDDKFVRGLFRPSERGVLEDCSATKCLPEGWRSLFSSRLRWCRGNIDLRQHLGGPSSADSDRYHGLLPWLCSHPGHWLDFAYFLSVYLPAACIARLWPRSQPSWVRRP